MDNSSGPFQPDPQTNAPIGDQLYSGMSASSLWLNTKPGNTFDRKKWFGRLAIVLLFIIILAGIGIYIKSSSSNLGTKTLTNDNYRYRFKFYKSAGLVTLKDGKAAYKYDNKSVAGAQLTTDIAPSNCTEVGSSWSKAFSVNVSGGQYQVCEATVGNEQVFVMFFSALNNHHLFEITYNNDTQSTSDYPTIETMFSSISVSQ